MRRQTLGKKGEELAQAFIKKKGYNVREANYRCPHGEMDIIADKGNCLVFIEVRTRSSAALGTPEESINFAKKEKLRNIALYYLATHSSLPSTWRIDVVAVEMDRQGQPSRLEVIENALG
ncbi:MAG: YraN family protein [Chloroflexota bacterium]